MKNASITLTLVDDHAILRESLAHRLEDEPDFRVVGQAADAEQGMALIEQAQPTVAVFDINMPGMSCFDAAERLLRGRPGLSVVFLSAYWNESFIDQARDAGGRGLLSKSESPDRLATAIREVVAGQDVVSDEVADRLAIRSRSRVQPPTRLSTLTPRELQVLGYVAQGLSRKAIGQTMHISDNTVAVHTGKIMKKLRIHDRVELARYAIREGLAPL